jgi:hypothetical protein
VSQTDPENHRDFFAQFLDDYYAESDEHLTLVRRGLLLLENQLSEPGVPRTLLDGGGNAGGGVTAKIMIVDDSGMSRRTLRRILEPAGYEIVELRTAWPPSNYISWPSQISCCLIWS